MIRWSCSRCQRFRWVHGELRIASSTQAHTANRAVSNSSRETSPFRESASLWERRRVTSAFTCSKGGCRFCDVRWK